MTVGDGLSCDRDRDRDRARALTDPVLSPERRAAVFAEAHTLVAAGVTLRSRLHAALTGLVPLPGVTRRVISVLAVEAPIHVDELSRRVAASFGTTRLTDRVRSRILDLVRAAPGAAVIRADFVWRRDQAPGSWSVIRGPSTTGEVRASEQIPEEEIAAATAWILSRCLSTTRGDLIRQTARLFGITRAGSKVSGCMEAAIAALVRTGQCALQGERVEWRGAAASTGRDAG